MQTITCKYCHKTFELSEALDTEYKEKLITEIEGKHKAEREEERKVLEESISKKVRQEQEIKLKVLEQEKQEEKQMSEKRMEDILKLSEELRNIKRKDEERELESRKKLEVEREKIREELSKSIEEKANLEKATIQKKLDDTQKALEDAQRKSRQESQQLQGEILELELEEMLRRAFPFDEIIAVAKGVSGADIKHVVKSQKGSVCGTILWEFKRTKTWDKKWIAKLKDDLRAEKANVAAIVSFELPKEASDGMAVIEGVWVCNTTLVLALAELLRKNLYDIAYQKAIQQNSTEKASLVYGYLTSHECEQQIIAIVDTYKSMQDQLNKEKGAFERMWKQREGQIQKIFLATANIVGSIQGRAGTNILQIKGLELDELGSGE